MTYSIYEIVCILGINKGEYHPAQIGTLLTDSRQVYDAEQSLFFALQTATNDGHKYVQELYDAGVRNFVVQHTDPCWLQWQDANLLMVDNPLSALQKLATAHRHKFNIPVIGIVGSNGKTIVKEWLYQLLREDKTITRSPRSYNSQTGVPLSVWQISEQTELGIFEAGISQPGEMQHLQPIVAPTIGILTNIGDAHQEHFADLAQKCNEKLELFRHSNIIVCNGDNELINNCLHKKGLAEKAFTWTSASDTEKAHSLYIDSVKKMDAGTTIAYTFSGQKYSIEIPFADDASIENVINCLATLLCLQVPQETIRQRMKLLEPVAMRLDVRPGKNGCLLVNDSYNSDINSLEIALAFLEGRATAQSLRKVIILSDIPQSGWSAHELYTHVARLLAFRNVDKVIGIGTQITQHAHLFAQSEKSFYLSTDEFIRSGEWKAFRNEVILLKGSRHFQFERIDQYIEQKMHETVLEVNLDAIVHNFNLYRSKLHPNTQLVCMVKADAYGSGSSEVAKTLQYHRCDYLAVAIAEEGIRLREDGIKIPILVLNPEVHGFETLLEYSLEPEVYNFRILEAFIREANRRGISHFPIHLKIDTGMHRLGFEEQDLPRLTHILKHQNGLRIKGVFSHLAASESWVFDDFTTQQISTFKRIARQIEDVCGHTVIKHILNSAGIERFPSEQNDMARLGISLYGISAGDAEGVRNACSLRSSILQIKHIPKSETVGYGRRGVLSRDTRIATIRIGYADGLSRRLGNGVGCVWINGYKAPFVGNICMDLSMIDITDIPANEGDMVEVFGDHLSVKEVASAIDTIPYEVLTSVSARVKRVYFKE